MREMRNVYNIVTGEFEGKRSLVRKEKEGKLHSVCCNGPASTIYII
jgi:hypothetical protein